MYNNRRKGEDMFKLKKEKSPFNLNEKEEQVMKVLWKNDMPMSATEIANEIESDWAKKSIQNIIRKLESKNAIEITEITKIGKTYGRLFRPTVSSDEYAMEQFNRFYDKDDYAPFLLSALVDTKEENKELAQKLRDLIDQYKEE